MRFRFADVSDAELLAPLNAQLIRDEGHCNTMSVAQLADRMRSWLEGEYHAVVFADSDQVIGYALYRYEPDFVYLRQVFVRPEERRRGRGREALMWLWRNAWGAQMRLRVEVLVGNAGGQAFWRAVGFRDYCITMEMGAPDAP